CTSFSSRWFKKVEAKQGLQITSYCSQTEEGRTVNGVMENGGEEDNVRPIVYIVAGCIAGAIEAIATWPTEYIKTKLQLQKQSQEDLARARSEYVAPSPRPHHETVVDDFVLEMVKSVDELLADDPPPPLLPYKDMVSGVLYTVKTLGFFALYYGLTPTLLGSIPKAGIRFGLFSWFSHLLRGEDGATSAAMCFLAGCAAGVFEALLVVVPMETMKTKCIQLDMPFWGGLREVVLLEGIGGVYRGALATVAKQGSNQGLRFVWYSAYKRMVTHDGQYPITPAMAFFGGMTAGIFSALGNQPADVIKTRMQGVRAGYTSTWDCIRETYATQGIPGFYTGIIPRLSRVVPGQGILFLSYEVIVSLLLSLTYKN
ncbi:hypothetical protein ACHAWF_002043, partial [Thalassiosira exigua]